MQNFSSIGSVPVLYTRPKYYNKKKKNNNNEQTDMYEHLHPLSEQGVQKPAEGVQSRKQSKCIQNYIRARGLLRSLIHTFVNMDKPRG